MAEKKFNTIGELITSLASTYALTKVKGMAASKERQETMMMEAFAPYLNLHNVVLILSEKNITHVRGKIIGGMQRLDKHYTFKMEPTADNQDIFFRICHRPGGGTDPLELTLLTGFLSQITAGAILLLISKFFNNGPTEPRQLAPGQ